MMKIEMGFIVDTLQLITYESNLLQKLQVLP